MLWRDNSEVTRQLRAPKIWFPLFPAYLFLKADQFQADRSVFNAEFETEILHRLLFALARKSSVIITSTVLGRRDVLSKALEYIEHFDHEPMKIMDLCQSLQVSERTLQYVLHQRYGVSPKTYINALRLNQVRKELLNTSKKGESIYTIANHWGFWHMWQFAADYRRMFAELPSETVKMRIPVKLCH